MTGNDNSPISNRSLHGVAGEAGSSANIVPVVSPLDSTNGKRGWLDGVLHRNKIPPSHDSTEGEYNNISKIQYEDEVSYRTLVSLQEKIEKQAEELDKLRQETESQRRLNSEIKEHWKQNDGTNIEWLEKIEELTREITAEQSEKFRLLRRMTELDIHVGELDEMLQQERSLIDNKDDVDTRLVTTTRELVDTKVELQQAQRAIIRLQKEQAAIGSVYDKKFSEVQADINKERIELSVERDMLQKERKELQEQIQKMKQQESNTGEWQRQLFQKDDIITKLKAQISELTDNLTIAQQNVEASKTEAQSREQYRLEEAQDLRVLNDAQEHEISELKQQLEKAQNDLMVSDQRCKVLQQTVVEQVQPVEKYKNEVVLRESQLEESKKVIANLEAELTGTRNLIDQLNTMMKNNNESHELRVSDLMITLTGLSEERDSFQKQCEELRAEFRDLMEERDDLSKRLSSTLDSRPEETTSSNMHLQQAFVDLENKYNKLERNLLEAKLNLAATEEQKAQLQEDYEHKLSNLGYEEKKTGSPYAERAQRIRAQRVFDPYGELKSDSPARVSSLVAEVERLQSQLKELRQEKENGTQQSRGSLEEDMRKELEKSRKSETELNSRLHMLLQEKDNEKNELQARLEDRDTTISSLVKSVVTLEDQLESCKLETETLRIRLVREIGVEQVRLFSGESMSPEELERLRSSTITNKESDDQMKNEINQLKKELQLSKEANDTTAHTESMQLSTDNEDDESPLDISNASVPVHMQLKERDDAIARLVKQTFSQDKVIRRLRKECEKASKEVEKLTIGEKTGPEWEEIIQLRQEAEVFAGQVIEQDEEIEELRTTLAAQERQITALERELTEAIAFSPSVNMNTSMIRDLEAEVDELREANKEQLEELRKLRQTAREVTCSTDAVKKAQYDAIQARVEVSEYKRKVDELSRQKLSLMDDLEAKNRTIKEIETKLKQELDDLHETSNKTIKKLTDDLAKSHKEIEVLKVSVCKIDEFELEMMRTEIQTLQSNLEKQTKELDATNATIRELEGMLAQKNAEEAAAHEEEKEELLTEIESLNQQLGEAKKNLVTLEQESNMIEGFKQQLERAEEARSESERSIVENYERKLSLLNLDKDVTIDNLRKQLFEEKEANATENEEMKEQLQHYQVEVSDLREKLSSQIAERDTRIYALERTLEAQEQLVNNMKTEMDHLQGSMETAAARRRNEIDEMQQELLSLTSTNTKLDREIKSLQLELDSKEMGHNAEVMKLREVISKFENQSHAEHRTAADLQMELRVKEVKDRLEKLKWRNTSLKAENENLRERLEIAEIQAKENKRQVAQTEELRELVSKQTEQISELESELERVKCPTSEPADPEAGVPTDSSTVTSKSEKKEETPANSGIPPKSEKKNPEKKPAGPPHLRLTFRRKRANSGGVPE